MVTKASKLAVLEHVADRQEAKDGEHMSDMGIAGSGRATDATPKALDPAVVTQMAAFRAKLQASVGKVVLATAGQSRYRNQMLADVLHLVIAPMLSNRVAIAKSAAHEGADGC